MLPYFSSERAAILSYLQGRAVEIQRLQVRLGVHAGQRDHAAVDQPHEAVHRRVCGVVLVLAARDQRLLIEEEGVVLAHLNQAELAEVRDLVGDEALLVLVLRLR